MTQNPSFKLLASPEIFQKYPDYNPVIFYVTDFDSSLTGAYCSKLLTDIQDELSTLTLEEISTNPQIMAWREYYRSFNCNPKKFMNSSEALLTRVAKGSQVGSINPLVDLYNFVSMKYKLPIGGENWDAISSDLVLGFADGIENFDTRKQGEDILETVEPGEVVWADEQGVTCRKWNWRQCTRTQINETTKNIYFVIDFIGQDNGPALQAKEEILAHLKAINPKTTEQINF
jgi:DNA/RNA-binding domain of Phe-tRNA-synthetase-like protein